MANPPLSTPAEIAAANQQRQNAFLSSGYYDPNVPLSMQGPNSSFNNSPTDVSNQLSGYGNGQINWNPTNYIAGSEFGQSTPAHNAASGFQTGESGNAFGNFLDVAVPIILAAGTAAITGGAGAALGGAAIGGAAGTAIGTGVGAAAGTAVNDYGNSRPVTGGQLATSFVGGAAGSLASPLSSALSSSTGLNSAVSSGLVKGAIGAGTGAIGAAANGGNIGNAALLGGASGAASGLTSSLTGSSQLGSLAGGVAKTGINYLGGSGTSSTGANVLGGLALGGANYLGAGATGQGNTSGMTSIDTSLASTIGTAVPGLLQAGAGVYGSQNAAEAQTTADANAIGTQQNTLGNINNIWSTQQQLGQGADTALGSALGTNGAPANYSNFENMPGYQFAVQQGTQAIQRQAAAMGNAYTPNTAEAVGQYVAGTAAQDYNTYINQLMGAAGLGTTANQSLQTANQAAGNNISQLQQNQGQAQASGVLGASNSVGGLFSSNGAGTSLLGAAGNYLTGGGSGGSGGNSSGVTGLAGSALSSGVQLANGGTLLGANSTNPQGLGGSIVMPSAGQTLQYDQYGNIIGSADTSQYAGSANYGDTDTSGSGAPDWTSSNDFSNLIGDGS